MSFCFPRLARIKRLSPSPSPSPIFFFSSNIQILNKAPSLSSLLPDHLNSICCQIKQQKFHMIEQQPIDDASISSLLLRCQSQPILAVKFFNKVLETNLSTPSHKNFALILHILTYSKQFSHAIRVIDRFLQQHKDAQQVVTSIIESSIDSKCNSNLKALLPMIIKQLIKMGRMKDAIWICRRSIQEGIVPDVHAFNCILKVLNHKQCWEMYRQMMELHVAPNSFTFNILLRAMCEGHDAARAEVWLDEMESRGFQPDVVTYNTLMHGYCDGGRLEHAIHLYRIMERRGIRPDLVSYTIIITTLCKDGKVVEAHQLFDKMLQRGIDPDGFVYNVLVSGYCKKGRFREVRFLVEQMICSGFRPDSFTCDSMVREHIRAGKMLSCLNFLAWFRKIGTPITLNIYKSLISYLCMEKRPNAARRLFELMLLDGYKPDVEVYNTLIASFCECEFMKEALCFKNEMSGRGIKPNLHTYQALISCVCMLGKPKEGEQLMEEMVNLDIKPNSHICSYLFKTFFSNRDLYKAEAILKYLAVNFQVYDISSYNTLLRLFSEVKGSDETLDLRDRMLEIGYIPNWLTNKALIDGLLKIKSCGPH